MSNPSRPLFSLPLAATTTAAVLLAACASQYDPAYEYHSPTRAAAVRSPGPNRGTGPVAARVSAEVIGLRDGAPDGHSVIDVKLRVERTGEAAVRLVADETRLVTADETALRPAAGVSLGPAVPAVGGASSWRAEFPLPSRERSSFDLSTLELRVALDVDGRRETVHVPFERGIRVFLWADPWGWPGPDYKGLPQGWRK